MDIIEITSDKKEYIDILLIGDEQESMIDKYLDDSRLFALFENSVLKSVCLILKIDNETIEIKNIATYPEYQKQGCATSLINYLSDKLKPDFKYIILGTGENSKTLSFYKKRGFYETHRIQDFFINNYDHPIFEDGKRLSDMIYLKKDLV